MNIAPRRKQLRAINWMVIILITISFLPASRVIAETAPWQPIGPQGGSIGALALSPNFTTDNLLFAARNDLYRSIDRGNSWASPSLTSVFEETSGVPTLAISPDYKNDQTLLIGTGTGVYRSADGGVSAIRVSDSNIDVRNIVISPNFAIDGTAFAGTQSTGVYRTTNSGASWSPTSSGIPANAESISALAISPNYGSDTTIFTVTWGRGVYRSTNGGSTWQAVNNGLGNVSFGQDIAISPGYANDQTIFTVTTDGLYRSTNGGTSWSKVTSVGLGSLSQVVLSPNYVQDRTILVNQTGYLLRSRDAGATWARLIDLSNPLGYDWGSVAFSPNYATDRMLFAWDGGINGVWRSNDSGDTWNAINIGLTAIDVNRMSISPDYVTDGTIISIAEGDLWMTRGFNGVWSQKLAGSSLGVTEAVFSPNYQADQTIFAINGHISRSQDGGETWAPLSNLPQPFTTVSHDYSNLLISPAYNNDRTLFVVMTDYYGDSSGLYRSVNDGGIWQRLSLPGTNVPAITAIAPTYPHEPMLLAGVYGKGIYRSADGGTTWQLVYTLQSVVDGDISTIQFSPDFATDRIVLAGTADGLLRSTDGGLTWHKIGPFGAVGSVEFSPDYRTTGTFYISEAINLVYAGGRGIYQTTDRGASFSQIGSGLGIRNITDIGVLPIQPEAVLVSTNGSGVWALGNIGACSYPEPVALQQQIHALRDASHLSLSRTLVIGEQAAQHGDYFAREVDAAGAELVAELVFDAIDIAGNFDSVGKVIDATKLALPGAKAVGWHHILELKDQARPVFHALPSVGFTPNVTNLAAPGRTLLGQTRAYLAWAADEAVTDLGTEIGTEITSDIARGISGGMYDMLYAQLPSLAQAYDDKIRLSSQTLVNSRLCIDPALQQLYVEDLRRREQAHDMVRYGLEVQAQTLARARSDTEAEQDRWLIGFGLNFLARFAVFAAFDGPGLIALGSARLVWNAYSNVQKINHYQQMVISSIELVSGVVNEQNRLYSNTVSAVELIRQRQLPLIPLQTLVNIQDETLARGIDIGGAQIRPFEHTSQTIVTIDNLHDFPITFEGYARYETDPGWWQNPEPQITKYAVTIQPYQRGELIFSYRYEGRGESPRPGSEVSIQIVGATDTGLYPIYSAGHVWNPITKPVSVGQQSTGVATTDPPLAYPLSAFVMTDRDQLTYLPTLVVRNPFPQTVTIRAVQPLPAGASVLDTGGGNQTNSSIVWERSLAPSETIVLSHTISYTGTPGSEAAYPPAVLHITDPNSQLDATFDGFGTIFAVRSPFDGQFDIPFQVVTGQIFKLKGLIRNLANVSKTGTITIAIYDQNGTQIEQAQQDVTLAAQNEQILELPLYAPSQVGVISVIGTLTVDGTQVPLVACIIDVDQAQVMLPLVVRP